MDFTKFKETDYDLVCFGKEFDLWLYLLGYYGYC